MKGNEYKVRFPGAELMTVALKEQMGRKQRKRKRSPESIQKQIIAQTGRVQSEESNQKRSWALMGHPVSKVTREKISRAGMGQIQSEEEKAKRAVSLAKWRAAHPEYREEQSLRRKQWLKDHPEECATGVERMHAKSVYFDSRIEKAVEVLLLELGLNYEKQASLSFLPGRMGRHRFDFVLRDHQLVVEADGCFWHGCSCLDGRNYDFILEQMERDMSQISAVELHGWVILRFWEHDIYQRLDWVRTMLSNAISSSTRRAVQ